MEPVVFAAERFGFYEPFFESLTDGLIHKTYKVTSGNKSIIIQEVNTTVFKNPEQVVENYQIIYAHLSRNSKLKIPASVKTTDHQNLWIDPTGSCWRAFEYISNTYTETLPSTPEKIKNAAQCFGEFIQAMSGLDPGLLSPTISGFHDPAHRYQQLQEAIETANPERLKDCEELLVKIRQRKKLVDFYNTIKADPEFKLRAMHHDCKLSNILFDRSSGEAVCPIDLDTTMSGYFFSDIGDMIRSMVSEKDEHAPSNSVKVNRSFYQAIVSGYQSGIGNSFTEAENAYIHHSGMLMLYMQGIRFLTDYLSNDVYYKITFPKQNFDRASNQVALLEKLEVFLEEEYQYKIK